MERLGLHTELPRLIVICIYFICFAHFFLFKFQIIAQTNPNHKLLSFITGIGAHWCKVMDKHICFYLVRFVSYVYAEGVFNGKRQTKVERWGECERDQERTLIKAYSESLCFFRWLIHDVFDLTVHTSVNAPNALCTWASPVCENLFE